MRAQYTLLCDDVRPSLNGTNDFLGAFDRITAPKVPAIHRRMTLAILLVADNEDGLGRHTFVLRVEDPKGNKMFEQTGAFQTRAEAGTWMGSARLQFAFEGFPLPIAGKYWFRLLVDGEQVTTHPLSVVLGGPPR